MLRSAQTIQPQPTSTMSPRPLWLFKVDTTSLFFNLLALYLITFLYTYPYGIKLGGTASFRLVDIFTLLMIGLGGLLLLQYGRINATVLIFWPLLPLFLFEVTAPLLSVPVYGEVDGISNAIRIVLLHAPVLIAASFCASQRLDELTQRIARIFQIALIANLIYASMQLSVRFEVLPRSVLFTEQLQPFAVDTHLQIGMYDRPPGFFHKVTELSQFGFTAFAFFFARYQERERGSDLFWAMFGAMFVIVSTGRAAYVALFLVVLWVLGSYLFSFKLRNLRRLIQITLVGVCFIGLVIWLLSLVTDVNMFFERVFVLTNRDGLERDESLSARMEIHWPRSLRRAEAYPFGTLRPAAELVGLVDSGFLSYYIQARWFGVLILLFTFSVLFYKTILIKPRYRTWAHRFVLYLLFFIVPGMIVFNPTHVPLFIFMLYYGIWVMNMETIWKKAQFGSSA